MTRYSSTRLGAALMMAPLLVFLVLAYAWPFLGIVKWSFTLPEPGLGQYGAVFTDPLVQSVFIRTLRICAIVTLVSVIGAYAITLVWVRGTPTQRMIAEFCILVPFWISVLTRAFGWLALLSNGDCAYLPEPLSYFRLHGGQDQRGDKIRIQANIEWLQLLCDAHEQGKYLRQRKVVRDMLTAKLPTCIWYLSSVHEQVEAAYDLDKINALLQQAMSIILRK